MNVNENILNMLVERKHSINQMPNFLSLPTITANSMPQLMQKKYFYLQAYTLFFSNLDATIQLIAIIKQLTAMEASLVYMRNGYGISEPSEDQDLILKSIQNIKNKIKLCQMRNKELIKKTKQVTITLI